MGSACITTKLGEFRATITARGVQALRLPGRHGRQAAGDPLQPGERTVVRVLTRALCAHAGGRPWRDRIPLDLSAGTDFQRRVWRTLRSIPFGETRSYAWVARRVGRPRAARAVGAACGANPVPVLVPCHRVVAGDGSLGGFSAGLGWKRRLLALEGGGGQICTKLRPRTAV
ncbi:methylated-DNA--[protein]-cysteine S-methyltransferase [bacterium]|nr:methylated-DNA--[protein]-cysteine S-methyltransferase [bacterium]